MDFGSKYIYKYDHSESESVSDDDNMLENDADSLFIPQATSSKSKHQKAILPASNTVAAVSHRRRRLRKPDTNVLSVKFNRLLLPGEMHAGDPVYCTHCGAIASHLSKIEIRTNDTNMGDASDEPQSKWSCEFCSNTNIVDIDQSDLPKQEDATYLISPAPVVHGSDMTGIDDSIVLFLIDISGSMSSTTLVQGTFNLPNALKQQERVEEAFGGVHMIRQRNQTYVSRLQGVQMAVDANLDKLVKDSPTRRAALLAFNHEITYYGDGTRNEPLVIRGDKLNNGSDLLNEAEKELNNELKPVSQTKTKLTERIYDLEEGGQTALGPAVVFALNIASRRQGSKIVICTDGLANRGLGSLELAQDKKADPAVKQQALGEGNQFYAELTERAREKGVSISVITIKGTACLLPVIGQMADGTGGNVTIVDLLNMRDEFASILDQKTIATNVEATLIVHRGLYIRNPDNLEERLEKIKRDIGNVTKHTEVTFEFGIRNIEEVKQKYNIDLNQLQQLPFQVQVTYTAADGSKALRVLTQLKETTEDRETAEINAIRSVIAENHIRNTANDMMAAISDDEDNEAPYARSRWSTPAVQKQRVAYMDNLTSKVRSRGTYEVDQFNERRWNTASNELQTHVITSRARRTDALRSSSSSIAPPPRGSSSHATDSSENKAIVPSTTSRSASKRTYGFATSNLNNFSDQHSEDLYRYKNISSDYMRETSPIRDEHDRPAITSSISQAATRRNNDYKDRPAAAAITSRANIRQSDEDDRSSRVSDTRRPGFRRNESNAEDRSVHLSSTRRPEFRRNDSSEHQPVHGTHSRHVAFKEKDDDSDRSS